MRKPDWLKGRVLILGLGREGQATLRFLRRHWPGLEIAVADQRSWEDFSEDEKKLLSNVPGDRRHLGSDYLSALAGYGVIFKTPGENRRKPEIAAAIRAGVLVTSATNLFFELKKGRVVAVTGSKGKSTTASLIDALLKAGGLDSELVGNIGRAALDYLEHDGPDKVYVFEMSSYQLEDYRGGADVAVLVSFFPEHLDYHGSLEEYFDAKMRLAVQFKPGLKVLYNQGNETLRGYFAGFARAFADDVEVVAFNDGKNSLVRRSPADDDGGQPRYEAVRGGEIVAEESHIKLQGRHNLENILAAAEVAALFEVPLEAQQKALLEFVPLEHRLEPVGTWHGITFYNDAISTTPESTIAALETLGRKQPLGTLIAGGLDRGYHFDGLAREIIMAEIDSLILLPESGKAIEEAVEKYCQEHGQKAPLFVHCGGMEQAVKAAYRVTPTGTICLLSCASPSYNLFKNFEERGRLFKAAVKNMPDDLASATS